MFGKVITVRPSAAVAVRPVARTVVVRSQPNVEKAVQDAQETCKDDAKAKECANAWDDVEELSAAAADKKAAQQGYEDPLEKYCEDAPEADECRVYDN